MSEKKEQIKKQANSILGKQQVNTLIFQYNLARLLKNLEIFKDSGLKKAGMKIHANALHTQIIKAANNIKKGFASQPTIYAHIEKNQEHITRLMDIIHECTSVEDMIQMYKVLNALAEGHEIKIIKKED